MPPSDFVLHSSRSSFSQTKKNWPERLLPRPLTLQTLTHNVKFIFLRTSPLRCLRRHFATHGIPDELVTDNGPQFTADEFKTFSTSWMFRHTTTSPYHPPSNGIAESTVKTAKKVLRTAIANGEDAWLAILTHGTPPRREWPQAQRNDYWAATRRRHSQWTLTSSCRTPSRDQDKHDLQQRLD